MSITRRLHALLRKLLFSWIRVDVLPQNPLQDIDPEKPVLYVLAARGLSELLVLERICKQQGLHDPLATIAIHGFKHHSVYSVASRNPVSDWLLQQRKHSLMLEELVAALQADADIDISVVPVSVFWGRPIAKQRHWLKVLFSDTWELGGRTRKFFTLLLNGRQTTLIFSTPQSFRELSEQAQHSVEDLNDALAQILRQQREATFGPELIPRTRMISDIINAPPIEQQYQQLAEDKNQSREKSRKQAIKYCHEIFANCTQISQELMKRLLHNFWRRFYSGIEVFDIEQVKKLALDHQLIYLPNHRSHIDYLLLSYVIFKEGLALPYIAAGDNLNMPIIGRILKGGGAFFIRRSFRDNPLYSAILSEYVRELVQMGVPIEYFIEGGRSRTGRLLKPKLGMLSMTVDGWIRTQNRPLAFVPVYIGYEKLVEGRAHLGELYGEKKKKESLFSSIRSIFKLRGQFGKVTTRFGEPIILDQWLDRHRPDWAEAGQQDLKHQDWFRHTVKDLSSRIMMEINRAAVVNPVNLIATALLATPRQSIDEYDLLQLCEFYQRLIKSQSQLDSIRIQDKVNEESLQRIKQQGLIHIREHQLGNIVYLKPEHAVLMSYYRNNSLHTLI
nr:glycerol-3-phosphate 1-O-acyltransferase PlsB [Gammaproteobacteria bacterium]